MLLLLNTASQDRRKMPTYIGFKPKVIKRYSNLATPDGMFPKYSGFISSVHLVKEWGGGWKLIGEKIWNPMEF